MIRRLVKKRAVLDFVLFKQNTDQDHALCDRRLDTTLTLSS